MCVREYKIEVPYGVVTTNLKNIVAIKEKPIHSFFVNSGIYLLEPNCIEWIPSNEFYDMPMLFQKLIEMNEKVISFPIKEYWKDIGHLSDYELAIREYGSVFD